MKPERLELRLTVDPDVPPLIDNDGRQITVLVVNDGGIWAELVLPAGRARAWADDLTAAIDRAHRGAFTDLDLDAFPLRDTH